ncbi:hypothetical protein GCM10029964_104580 [Kibdelosporangium lantanae]
MEMHAANRDAAVFPDPDTLDLARPNNPHVTFGHGVHHCLGAPLARLELRLGLTGLLTRMPGLRLTVPYEEIPWRTDRLIRGAVAPPSRGSQQLGSRACRTRSTKTCSATCSTREPTRPTARVRAPGPSSATSCATGCPTAFR